jgi:protein TonB
MYQRELQFVLPEVRTNVGTVFGGAGIIYAGLAAIMALLLWIRPPAPGFPANVAPPSQMPSLIFLNVVGATGGGGGGGDRSRALLPLKTSPVPAVAPPLPPVTIVPPDVIPPPLDLTPPAAAVPALATNADLADYVPTRPPSPGSLGPGDRGAGGPGPGGIGPGTEPNGIGPGGGPNMGPGPGGSGGIDQQVALLQMQKPNYTPEGMLHKVQGEARLLCTVLATGRVGSCTVVKPVDSNRFGLDDEAIKAAMKFVFKPAMRQGKPVPVQVNIVIEFTMR